MKVLFLTAWYPTEERPVEGVFVREHAKAAALANEVVVLHAQEPAAGGAGLWSLARERDEALAGGIPTWRVRHRVLPVPRTTSLLGAWAAARASRRLDGFRPDVVHAHVYTVGAAALLAGRFLRAPVVISEHFTGFPRGSLTAAQRRKASLAFRRAALVLPVSHQLESAIRGYGIEARFRVVPNAVDLRLFHPGGEREPGPARLLFVGALEATHKKGFPVLLDALARLRAGRDDWRVDVVGDGPVRAEYERLAAERGLAGHIVFHGFLPKEAVADRMRASDLFVLPSIWENLPCVIAEAMATGLPVVATTTGGVPEMVSEATGELAPPGDAEALAAALERALERLPAFDRPAITALARERYALEAVGAQLDDVYRTVTGR